jgi:hypothetical protein
MRIKGPNNHQFNAFLSANPAATASYNQQIADTINSYKASNNNIHLHQEIITSILQSSSSAFPALQVNKKEWFAQDATNLITLISVKKKSEQKYHQEPTNPATIAAVHLARTNVKKAIKKAQEKMD